MKYRVIVLMLIMVAVLPSTAMADPEVETYGMILGSMDVETDKGKVSMGNAGAEIEYGFLTLSYDALTFNWKDKNKLPFGNKVDDPWDTLHSLELSAGHSAMLDDTWGIFGGIGVGANYEKEISGSFGGSAHIGGIYAYSERLQFTFGVAGSVDSLEGAVMPLLGMSYDGHDETGEGWFAEVGVPEVAIGYDWGRSFGLSGFVGMNGGTWRLADESTVSRDGYVSMNAMQAGLSATWRPADNFEIAFGPMFNFAGEMELNDKEGDKIETYDLGNAFGGFLSVSYEF